MGKSGVRYSTRTLPNGKQVRVTISPSGRIVRAVPATSKVNRTKTGKRLNKRRRRIDR